jgi:hypothetical protein
MTTSIGLRRLPLTCAAALLLFAASPAAAEDNPDWNARSYRAGDTYAAPRSESYPPPAGDRGYSQGGNSYGGNRGSYAQEPAYAPPTQPQAGYANNDAYAPSRGYSGAGSDAYAPSRNDGHGANNGYGANDAYSANRGYGSGGNDAYSPARHGDGDRYTDPGQPVDSNPGGYGAPYAPPPAEGGAPYADQPPQGSASHYEQNEIIAAGHGFFGAISQGLGQAVEYAFKSQGRPNGYILGEDAGGAFVVGLRYGEGRLYTKDAGDHKVFWQGPSLGYDAGAEGSKAMVLVYNMHDPSEIYNRFGGVQGSAYLVGGLSVQFQKYGDVTLAVIRSGVGLRLGANVGYLKYTRAPTWNPL